MTVIRAQCAWQLDSGNPTDVAIITPHFKDVNLGPLDNDDYQGLANDLADGLDGWATIKTQLVVKLYDAQSAPPNFPKASATRRPGQFTSMGTNRDLAVCLSFFASVNRPRYRGRLYVPACIASSVTSGGNVNATLQTKVSTLVPILTGLGGVDVDWVVFSRADNTSRPITDWYVDNAWDTQRRRGALPSARLTGSTTEGAQPNMVRLQAQTPDVEAYAADESFWPAGRRGGAHAAESEEK